ncbi:MAG: hypothetical protein QOG88_787 [Actinomycetota bacterium]|jgi:hypothetical protein|nr:hypothetical protein [Actinomycetota bacterium]
MKKSHTALVTGIVAALAVTAIPAAVAAHNAGQRTAANCTRNQLTVRANGTEGTAGTIHGAWVFTNRSGTSCQLYGYPDMQLYNNGGQPIPTTVKRNLPPGPSHVTLAPGGSGTFYSSYSDVSSTSHPCPTSAVAEITAPNASASLFIPAQLQPCRGIVNVSAVLPGVHHA